MRILIASSSYAPRTGGLETVTRRLAYELRERGHQVSVVTNKYPRTLPARENIDGIQVNRHLYADVLFERGNGWRSRLKQFLLLPAAPVGALRLALLLFRLRPELINAHYFSYPTIYAILLGRWFRIPVVLSFHGSDLLARPRSATYERFLRYACKIVQAYTTNSIFLSRRLVPMLTEAQKANLIVAPNGVQSDAAATGVPQPDLPYVFLAGRLVEPKGVDVALRSVAILQGRGLAMQLIIAGDGPERSRLVALAESLNVRSQVTFLGSVPQSAVVGMMEQAELVVIPSRFEGFGMVCLEAMIAGKAVVASRAGGIPEIVLDGQTGLLVDPDQPAELAESLHRLLTNPSLANEMGKKGRERATLCFGWDRTVDAYLGAYARAMEPVTVDLLPADGGTP